MFYEGDEELEPAYFPQDYTLQPEHLLNPKPWLQTLHPYTLKGYVELFLHFHSRRQA